MPYNIFKGINLTTATQTGDIVSVTGNEVTTGMWSNDTGSLSAIYTSSVQFGVSGEYYYDLYNGADITESDIQFSVAYGHISGGGAPLLSQLNSSTLPTQATYYQYRNILLDKNVEKFTFGTDTPEEFYVINIQRARLKQAIDPGNWQLGLSGSNGIFTFIDDSNLGTSVTGNLIANNVYKIRSGSLNSTPNIFSGDSNVYGLAFPDYGVLILYPAKIANTVGFATPSNNARNTPLIPFAPYTGSVTQYQYNHEGLVRSISGSMAAGRAFIARSAEEISSTNYFIRLGNSEYNYSNNPTYYTGSQPQQPLEPFRVKPITYVTTIGLYNNSNELLAVAKLSKPVQKSIDKEVLIRVRLDY
jgi:hypothetical protein